MRVGGMTSRFWMIGSLFMAKYPSIAASTLQFRKKASAGSTMAFMETSAAIGYSFLMLHKSLVPFPASVDRLHLSCLY